MVSLIDHKILSEKNPDLPLNPASNMKLVTMAAALRALGPDFTFKTEFYANHLMNKEGRLGPLWIKGYGDPLFITEELEDLVQRFVTSGLQEIQGPLYVDDTYFDHYNLTTYLSDTNEKLYNIFTGPLSFNFNSVRKHRHQEGIIDPAIHMGEAFKEALAQKGIVVGEGPLRDTVPSHALLILTHTSPPLKEILKGMGKFSNNFIAEQLLKGLGVLQKGPPGSTQKGVEVLKNYLHSLGIQPEAFTIENGSGLSKAGRLSAAQLISVLEDMYNSPYRNTMIDALSVVGVDGTMKRKMRRSSLKGNVFVKTGTLNDVRSLSGYLLGEKPVAFVIIFNGPFLPASRVTRFEEAFLKKIGMN